MSRNDRNIGTDSHRSKPREQLLAMFKHEPGGDQLFVGSAHCHIKVAHVSKALHACINT